MGARVARGASSDAARSRARFCCCVGTRREARRQPRAATAAARGLPLASFAAREHRKPTCVNGFCGHHDGRWTCRGAGAARCSRGDGEQRQRRRRHAYDAQQRQRRQASDDENDARAAVEVLHKRLVERESFSASCERTPAPAARRRGETEPPPPTSSRQPVSPGTLKSHSAYAVSRVFCRLGRQVDREPSGGLLWVFVRRDIREVPTPRVPLTPRLPFGLNARLSFGLKAALGWLLRARVAREQHARECCGRRPRRHHIRVWPLTDAPRAQRAR